jgi:hypothetical protein
METNAIHSPPASEPALLARARPFEPDPPAVDGTCGRCGFRGAVYAAATEADAVRFATGCRTAGCLPAISDDSTRAAGSEGNDVGRKFRLRFLPLVQRFDDVGRDSRGAATLARCVCNPRL